MGAVSDEMRAEVTRRVQGALSLQVAFIGVANGFFELLDREGGGLGAETLAWSAETDAAYTERWCDAAYAFELLELDEGGDFTLSALGRGFLASAERTLLPFAVMANLTGHMAERAAVLMRSGERPGERVIAEREGVLPLYGPMMEANYGPLFERQILPSIEAFSRLDARAGVAVDLGCGNGWYLRRLARRYPRLRGVGMDMSREAIDQARAIAEREGLADRLAFERGDLYHFALDEPVELIAMSRALHHVWGEDPLRRREVFRRIHDRLAPGGVVVIWEPVWPKDRAELRDPARRGLAFQNLAEHVQGNRFLHPDEIVAALEEADLSPRVHLFAQGREAVIVGTRGR